MSNANRQTFVTDSEASLLLRYTFPMLGAILALFSYDLFESSLVATQNAETLAAFGFTLPITAAMTALAIGLSIRSNNKAVQCNCVTPELLSEQVVHSLITTTVIVSLSSVLFYFLHDVNLAATGFANWLEQGQNLATAQHQSEYMNWRYLGWVLLALIWQVNAILRALGWMKLASRLLLSWILVKAVLAFLLLSPTSPYLWYNFSGLGLAHFASDLIFALISLFVLSTKVPFKIPTISFVKSHRSLPKKDSLLVVLQQFITPLSMGLLTALAASLDSSYVAALALLFRLEVIFLILPMVLTTSMPAIVGANFWLDRQDRVRQFYRVAFLAITGFQIAVALVATTQGHLISMFVCPHEAISEHIETYLKWVPWGYIGAGVAIVLQSCLNAKNLTVQASLLGVLLRLVFVLPFTSVGGMSFGFEGFYQGMMLGHLCALLGVLYLLRQHGFSNVYESRSRIEAQLE